MYGAEPAMYIEVVPRTLKSCATRLQDNQIPVELLGELPLRNATDVED